MISQLRSVHTKEDLLKNQTKKQKKLTMDMIELVNMKILGNHCKGVGLCAL